MNLSIGMNIRSLRIQKSLTQEELASHLGVSPQTVSKWERGDCYPDIELLPAIAHYFGTSTDALMGMSEAEKTEKYEAVCKVWSENNRSGRNSENVLLMRDALKAFPNDALLLVQLSTSLEKLDGTPEEKEKNLRESIAVQEQIISYCEDCEVRGATLFNICFAYRKIGDHEKALAQAMKLPNLFKGRENALVYLLQGEEKNKVAREALTPLAWSTVHHLSALAETEDNKEYYKKAAQILDILFDEKDEFISKMYNSLINE